jgi:hypothetical protein
MSSEEFTIVSYRNVWPEEARKRNCPRYHPCPICYKCMVKASHLFVKCQDCPIPLCQHSERDRELMIRRENFSPKFPLRTQ